MKAIKLVGTTLTMAGAVLLSGQVSADEQVQSSAPLENNSHSLEHLYCPPANNTITAETGLGSARQNNDGTGSIPSINQQTPLAAGSPFEATNNESVASTSTNASDLSQLSGYQSQMTYSNISSEPASSSAILSEVSTASSNSMREVENTSVISQSDASLYQTPQSDTELTQENSSIEGANSSSTSSSETSTVSTSDAAVTASADSSNTYPVGQCTWGVKELASWAGNNWGNGADWATSAAAAGYTVGTTPQVGAIIVWDDGAYGHVAYVTAVNADGTIEVMESNYNGDQSIANYRGAFDPSTTTYAGEISYIYPST